MDPRDRALDLYESGQIVEAAREYKRLAALGEKESIVFTGWLYYSGTGVEKDHREALRYFEQDSVVDHFDAAFYAGKIYESRGNYETALERYKIGDRLGDCSSTFRAGWLLLRTFNQQDEGLSYLKRASEKGHFVSRGEYAKLLVSSSNLITKLYGVALWLRAFVLIFYDGLFTGFNDERARE